MTVQISPWFFFCSDGYQRHTERLYATHSPCQNRWQFRAQQSSVSLLVAPLYDHFWKSGLPWTHYSTTTSQQLYSCKISRTIMSTNKLQVDVLIQPTLLFRHLHLCKKNAINPNVEVSWVNQPIIYINHYFFKVQVNVEAYNVPPWLSFPLRRRLQPMTTSLSSNPVLHLTMGPIPTM